MGSQKQLTLMILVLALATLFQVGATSTFLGVRADTTGLPKSSGSKTNDLFNGRDLNGWTGLSQYWSVKDGFIRGHEDKENSKQTFLVFAQFEVKDFELHAKYRFSSPEGNSGIQFRSTMIDPQASRVGGYQADFDAEAKFDGSIYDEAGVAGGRGTMSNRGERTVWDSSGKRHDSALFRSGAELAKTIKRGSWNDIVLIAKGPHITYNINGQLMTDLIDNSSTALRSGLLGLQLHEGYTMEVDFTDLTLKIL